MPDPIALSLGIATTLQLSVLGWSKWRIERAVRDGVLARVRPGWFAHASASADALEAVRAGGCVSCFSALRLRGAWVPEVQRHHVRRAAHRQGGCRAFGAQPPVLSAVDDLESAFRCALRCGSAEDVLVVLDSLLHRRLASVDELRSWMLSAPLRLRRLLELADWRAESGTETMVRVRLRSLQIGVRIQVRVVSGVRVDLLVGERLVIECDSREHHAGRASYEADRARDRWLLAHGFLVLRLSYRQVHDDWPEIERDILAIVRRGDHRFARRRNRR
ncbi:endonuclease domain-containing protein [Agrococcus terreus]|uniref:DUF559 domain-containing protein n=1 Tax=Agrococcus terreus TaxID=574649 RepID=A0ABQ2KDD0_9MICO|nr:DUF559 domain-containing protein [Agrococcus terreus]GGN79285.1 hypothetical protein GCM10010968_06090 [Agrococcus terreus]